MQKRLYARVRAVNIWLMAPLLGLAVFMAVFAAVRPAQAATSSNLNFQARLLTNTGAVVSDGTYNIDFKIYNADSTTGSVGTCAGACLWEETRTGANKVNVINGYFSVNLGSVTSFPSTINWDQPLWLTMNIGGTGASPVWDGEMQDNGHSISLTALPYSFVAGQLAKTDGSGNRGVLGFSTVANNPSISLPDASGTVCLQSATACGFESTTGTDFIRNSTSLQATANFNIQSAATGSITAVLKALGSQTANLLQLQNSSGNAISFFNANGDLIIGGSNATTSSTAFKVQDSSNSAILNVNTTNGTVTIGAGDNLTITGSGTRPSSPTEGMLYYDTTIKRLLVYSNSKWQADRSTASKIVAMGTASGCSGTSPVSSLIPDSADYVITSCTTAETTINSAITALGSQGGTVYLEEGTYIVDGPINIPSNVTLAGSGAGTVIKLVDSSTGVTMIQNSDSTNGNDHITIRDLKLDGNQSNQTNNSQDITLTKVGASSSTQGAKLLNLWVENSKANGISLVNTNNVQITNVNATGNGSSGLKTNPASYTVINGGTYSNNGASGIFFSGGGSFNTITNVDASNNTVSGIAMQSSANNNTITGNNTNGNTSSGVSVTSSSNNNTVTGNTSSNNGSAGISLGSSSQFNTVSGNVVANNSTSGIILTSSSNNTVSNNLSNGNANSGITLSGTSSTLITGNKIIEGNNAFDGIRLTSTSTNNTVSNNDISGGGGSGFAINVNDAPSTGNSITNNRFSGTGATTINDAAGSTYSNQQLSTNGDAAFRNGTNSATAFQVQNAGGISILAVDTSGGAINVGKASSLNGNITFYNSSGSGSASIVLAGNPTTSYTYQLPTSSVSSGQCLQSGTVSGSTVPLTFGACGASGTFLNKNATDTSSANAGSGYLYGFTNSGSAGSGGVLDLENGTNTGIVLNVKGTGSNAVVVQNSSSQQVFGVNTSSKQAVLGQANTVDGSLLFQNSSGSNGITINSTATSSNYTLTLPTVSPAGGLCIETSTGNASQLIFASCSNNNASIQEVHEWDVNNTNIVPVSPSTAGDVLVLTTQIPTSSVTVNGVSGGGVTTWNKVIANNGNGTVNRVEMWVGTVTTTGSSNITVTYSSSPGAEEVAVTEFTAAGVNASTSWGIESSAAQLNSTSSGTVTYPNMTAVNGSELYVGYAQVQNPPATSGSSTGFNYIQTSTQHNMIAYNTSLAANTSYQPTANQNSPGQSNTLAAILTAFVTSSAINNTTSLQKANFYVQAASSGTVAGVLQAASSGTADILDLRNSGAANVLTVNSTGNVLVQPSASATAFQVQNSSNFGVMTVDTSGNQVVLGDATHLSGKITFKDSGDSNTISIVAPSSVASSYTLTLPNNTPTAGLCLGTSPSNANQLIFASCATQVSAASISYVNQWGNSGTSVTTISDSPASIGDLLVFFSHSTNNVSITGVSGGGVTNWTKVTSNTGVTGGNVEMWRGVVTAAGAATITATYSGAAGTNDINAQEFSMGTAGGTWAIDTSGTTNGTSATINYPSLTPASSSELYDGYAWGANTMSAGTTTGYTYVPTSLSKYTVYDTSVTGGTPQQPTASQNASGNYNSIAALIQAYAGTSVIVNSTAVQQANFDVQAATSGTVAGVLQAASSGTADVLDVKDSSGNNVMSVNPSSGVTLGTPGVTTGQIVFSSNGNSNTITISAPSSPSSIGASYNLILPSTTPAAGQCLATSPSNANQLVFSSCANQVTSVAISFVNSWKSSGNNISTLSVSPTNLNDLMVFFSSPRNGVQTTGVSGCGITWSKVSGTTAGSGADLSAIDMFKGVVTSTGACTLTATFSGSEGNPNELAAMEFTTGSTTGSWVIDASNTQFNSSSTTTATWPSLTPQSSKDLYVGYGAGGTFSGAVSSGYTYISGSLTNRAGLYNTSVSATSQPTATITSSASLTVGALIAAYSSSSVISNSTVTQQGNFNIQAATSGSVAGTLQAFPTGTGDILDLLNGAGTLVGKVGSAGNLLVEPSTASAAAFQVQTTGAVNVLSVDTSANQVVIGAGSAGESSPSLLVVDNETGTSADPTGVNGAIYYNATTRTFRCYAGGAWQNCAGQLYANTSQSSAVSNCSSACVAFSTAASIPANYCQAGKTIELKASGYFSSAASATNLQFGVYYGTDASIASNDVLIGSLSPAESVTSASNNYFEINFNIICFSTSSMQSGGNLAIQVGSAATGLTTVPMNSTSGTTVVSSSAKNLYIFPVWGTASSSNTATISQFSVTSP